MRARHARAIAFVASTVLLPLDRLLGAALAKDRDDSKRSYEEMTSAEKEILKDYDTGRFKQEMQRSTTPKLQPFRCNLKIKD